MSGFLMVIIIDSHSILQFGAILFKLIIQEFN